ncbi:hypothetical protein [Sphingomonas sp. T1]|uniref:hypothetical protein n=1 Tax=Sphingomonas sp. T1 TaxID=2653172 RepID=UPI00135B0EE6|nr:hypothetical protein [Sphingomonas sp. T1]
MSDDEILYFEHRAQVEVELAENATKPEVVDAHRKMADAYLERLVELRLSRAKPDCGHR